MEVKKTNAAIDESPNQYNEQLGNNILLTTLEKALDFCRSRSVFPLMFGPACCAMEMMQAFNGRYDVARYGMEAYRSSPRHADVMLVAGTITDKMAPIAKRIYEQMPDPKWVIAIGSCAITGGPFADSYCVTLGADKLFPVDVYILGCPPRPEAIHKGMLELRDMIADPKRAKVRRNG